LLKGQRYEGPFSGGQMHGLGQLQWPDGTLYNGQFCRNKIWYGLGRCVKENFSYFP